MKTLRLTALAALVAAMLFSACMPARETPTVDIPAQETAPLQSPEASPSPEPTVASEPAADEAWALFLNAGKADAALICIDGAYWLVDTGTKDGADALISSLKTLGVNKLNGIFLTHTHKDHTGGAEAITAAIPTDMLYRAQITTLTDKGKDKLTGIAMDCGLPETKLTAGETLMLGGAQLDILGPLAPDADDDNDNSLVMKLTVNGRALLLTGDMQFNEEQSLLAYYGEAALKADVLKVGNHGNPDATDEDFAAAVAPDIAVISTDTREDTDSANARVRDALTAANQNIKIYLTEDFTVGVNIDLSAANDALDVSDPDFDPAAQAQALYSSYTGMLVNRAHQIGEDFVPEDLVSAQDYPHASLTLRRDGIRGDRTAMEALIEMLDAAKDDGVSGFLLVSVYRTYADQQVLWNRKVEKFPSYGDDETEPIVTAYPGASEHQTGLAFDISAVEYPSLDEGFAQTEQGRWLYANSWRFGFILRYPKGSEAETVIVFEPWHFRYVGRQLAAYLFREGLTLEGFYKRFPVE